MFKPLPMKHLLIQALTEDLPLVSLVLAELEAFAPDYRSVDDERLTTIPGGSYRELFNKAQSRLDKLRRLLSIEDQPLAAPTQVVEERELNRVNERLKELWSEGSAFEEQLRRLGDQERLVNQTEMALDNFANLKVDLGLLQGEKQFLNLFIGNVPRDRLRQLEEALGLARHLLFPFQIGAESVNLIIAGPRTSQANELQSVLQAADFRPLPIPPELHHRPAQIRQEILVDKQNLARERHAIDQRLRDWGQSMRPELDQLACLLSLAEPFVSLDQSMRSLGQLGAVTGWIPARDLGRLEQALNERMTNPFLVTARDPREDERDQVPTVLHTNWFLAPFETLIRQYGIPRYGEIDPTPLFAISFVFMFGMMFGDLGHGAVIALAGWYFRAKLRHFSQFVMTVGLSASLFGWMYGSLFGYEEIIHPLWIAPLSDPNYMLSVALRWGIGFIVAVGLISIHNRLVVGQRREALVGNNGLVSLVLYLAGIWGLYQLGTQGAFGSMATLLCLGSLAALMAHKWHEIQAPPGERLLVVFIETLETITGYLSNTLSFLRVAAFSLNHVALAIAVFTLADMMQSTGHWITVVLGNIFILVLEGGIVVIQTLRLEYYEGFSRFYFGDGQEYNPLKLRVGAAPRG